VLPAISPPARPVQNDVTTHAVNDNVRDSAPSLHGRALARGSLVSFEVETRLPVPLTTPRARGNVGAMVATSLYYTSFLVIMASVSVFGVRMWRDAHRRPAPIPTAVTLVAGGRVEIAADRLRVMRTGRTRWTSEQARGLDAIEITGPLVVGHAGDEIVAIDLETGHSRFTWSLPAQEKWAVQQPIALEQCLFTMTIRGGDAVARCLDLGTGVARWSAEIAGGRDCVTPPRALPGAYLVQCPGWTTIVDDRDGAVSFDAGGIGLVRQQPASLLRADSKLSVAPWSTVERRFATDGEVVRGANDAAISAVMHGDRLVMRPTSSSDKLAIISRAGETTAIPATAYRLADNAPLVADCGGQTSPRFQLLELAPQLGATFDPSEAQSRVLALLDVEGATVGWTSHKIVATRHHGSPICRAGHYFVPLELRDVAGAIVSALWIVDAESGKTVAVAAFDTAGEASFANLTSDQIDETSLVAIGRTGVLELRWRTGELTKTRGLHDARGELERLLGPLP
jgi:hypothetical protein